MAYDETYFRTRETWRDWRIEARELIQAARIHRDSKVLEIGCGGGGLLRMLREGSAKVIGIETLEAALKLAQKQLVAEDRPATQTKRTQPDQPLSLGSFVLARGVHFPSSPATSMLSLVNT